MEAWREMGDKGDKYYTLIEQLLRFIQPLREFDSIHPGKLSAVQTFHVYWLADTLCERLKLQNIPEGSSPLDRVHREELRLRIATGWRVLRDIVADSELSETLHRMQQDGDPFPDPKFSVNAVLLAQDLDLIELIVRQAMRPCPEILPAIGGLRRWLTESELLSDGPGPSPSEIRDAARIVRATLGALVENPPPKEMFRVDFGVALGAVDVAALDGRFGILRSLGLKHRTITLGPLDRCSKVRYPDALRIALENFVADCSRYAIEAELSPFF